ncbi:MAG TPA: sigma-70 family RNA polymerase sigma factor [Lacipirellulaceae bacterium]|nr:sigma-70 family RNA polymerase sigma factor [Lacipirellulaceae bacterium]
MTSWPHTRYSLLARLGDAGDADAWQAFEAAYQPAIYRYARSRGLQESDALEVVQETRVAVHRAMPQWRPSHRAGSFRAWLAEAARRQTLQALRRRNAWDRARGTAAEQATLDQTAAATYDQYEEQLDERRWAFCCAAGAVEREVSELTWRAFWMTAVEGRAAVDVAAALGTTAGNVYSAKCRVLARIRRHVEEAHLA